MDNISKTSPEKENFEVHVATVIIQDSTGRILLKKRNSVKIYFEAPGGKLIDNETPVQAAEREIMEETGIKIDLSESSDPFKLEYELPRNGVFARYKIFAYFIRLPQSCDEISITKEHPDDILVWMHPKDVLDNLSIHNNLKNTIRHYCIES